MEEVGQEEGVKVPAGGRLGDRSGDGRLGREVMDQDGQAPDRELAAIEGREVDAVEAEEVRLYGVAVLAEDRDELRQFPAMPSAFWSSPTKSARSETLGFVAL